MVWLDAPQYRGAISRDALAAVEAKLREVA